MSDGRSAWFYLGLGCVIVLIGCTICVSTGAFLLYRWGKGVQQQLEDPERRQATAEEILGCDQLPEGYYPVAGFRAPFSVMEVVVLGDQPPGSSGAPGGLETRGFIYFEWVLTSGDDRELADYFSGRSNDARVLRRHQINIDTDEIVHRGMIDGDDADLMYLIQRGRVAAQGFAGSGTNAMILVDCPDDSRLRLAIWIAPEAEPGEVTDTPSLTGTPADEQAIAAFMNQFSLCR